MKTSLSLLFMLLSSSLFTQNLKVKVTSLGEPIGYSYIYVNGDAKAVADSMGIAYVPMSWLSIGDTISASFVGYEVNGTPFDADIKEKGELSLNLKSDFTIDEVVVKAEIDIDKLYRKLTRSATIYHWSMKYNTTFDFSIKKNGETIKEESGHFSFAYPFRVEGQFRRIAAYLYPDSDLKRDSSFVKQLIMSVHNPISLNASGYDQILKGKFYYHRTIEYKGIIDSCRVFSATMGTKNYITQIICYFDKESKNLTRYSLSIISCDNNGDVYMQRNSDVDLVLKQPGIFKNYVITQIRDRFKWNNFELNTHLKIKAEGVKIKKYDKWERVPNIMTLLQSDFTDKKY